MVKNTLKPALTWGTICFLLLYRTFPSDITVWWSVLTQWKMPVWQLMVTWTASILPPLIPLICFILFNYKIKKEKGYVIIMPLVLWLVGRLTLVTILWIITFKVNDQPPFFGGVKDAIINQIVIMYWNSHTFVSGLIIVTCGYAFWRERRL